MPLLTTAITHVRLDDCHAPQSWPKNHEGMLEIGMSSTENMYSEWGIGQWTGYDDGFQRCKGGKNGGKINTKGAKILTKTWKEKGLVQINSNSIPKIYRNIQ